MDVTFHEEVSYFVKPSSDSPLQRERGSEVQIRRDGMDDVLQAELGTEPIMLRDTDQSTTDSDRSPVIFGTISTDDKSYVPIELPVSMSDELPSNDRLPVADMSNELQADDGSSSDDSSNSLVQDGGIHEVNSDDSSTYQLPPRANRGKPKVQYEPDMMPKLNILSTIMCLLIVCPNHIHLTYVSYLVYQFQQNCKMLCLILSGLMP